MKTSSVCDALILIALSTAALYCSELFFSPYLEHAATNTHWKMLIHAGSNSTFWWLSFGKSFQITGLGAALTAASGILAALVFAAAYRPGESPPGHAHTIVRALSLPLLLLTLFNLDAPLMVTIAQSAATIMAAIYLGTTPRDTITRAVCIAAIGVVANLIFCSQLTPYFSALLVVSALIRATDESATKSFRPLVGMALLSSVSLMISVSTQLKRPPLPDFGFPGNARVVSDDGIAGNVTPLVGEGTVIAFVDRMALRHIFGDASAVAILIIGFALFRRRQNRDALWWCNLLLIFALFWDSHLPEYLSTLGPIETARRIMPGTFPFTFTPLAMGLTLVFFWLLRDAGILRAALIIGLLPLCIFYPIGRLSGADHHVMRSVAKEGGHASASPSYALLKHENPRIIDTLNGRNSLRAYSVAELGGSVLTSHRNKEKLRKLLSDGKIETRWSPKRGAQYGDEWIEVHLPHLTSIYGIQAQTGKYFSDFPRGLAIESCNGGIDQPRTLALRIPLWQGGIEISAAGYPYYTGQHDVTVYLPKPISAQCLRISQIAESPDFDWSVAELRLLTK